MHPAYCIQRTFLNFPELMGGRFSYCCVLRSVSYCAAHVAEVSPDVVKLKGYGGACLLEPPCLGGTSYEGLCFMLEWQESLAFEGDMEPRFSRPDCAGNTTNCRCELHHVFEKRCCLCCVFFGASCLWLKGQVCCVLGLLKI